MHRAIKCLELGVAACAALGLLATATPASSAGTGCPPGNSGFILWDISTEPYGVDNAVDAKGNADGWVCARPLYVVTDDSGEPFQIYNFIDNHFR